MFLESRGFKPEDKNNESMYIVGASQLHTLFCICAAYQMYAASLEANTSAAALPFSHPRTKYNPNHDICALVTTSVQSPRNHAFV